MAADRDTLGPILLARGADAETCRLAALTVLPEGADPPVLTVEGIEAPPPDCLHTRLGRAVWRHRFEVPARRGARYRRRVRARCATPAPENVSEEVQSLAVWLLLRLDGCSGLLGYPVTLEPFSRRPSTLDCCLGGQRCSGLGHDAWQLDFLHLL